MKNNQDIIDARTIAIEVNALKIHYPIRRGIFSKTIGNVKAVDSISFSICKGDIFALVGESGCGKTTTAQAILGLIPITDGSIRLAFGNNEKEPVEWKQMSSLRKREMRKHIQVVFQDPYSSLNPRMMIRSILEEPLVIHKVCPPKEFDSRIVELLRRVGLSEEYMTRYPHEFSGGQRQRIGIARALATNPECIIADEPVSALDVSIQAQIINLLQDLQQSYNQTQLFISHDLAVVRHVANKIAVMYLGRIVEMGTDEQVFTSPRHPYTSLLLESIPLPGKGREKKNASSANDNEVYSADKMCSFYQRCPQRKTECKESEPQLIDTGNGHWCACFNPIK
jgi:oligopeptide/dipeptide ABC transporter ATP-binding protein